MSFFVGVGLGNINPWIKVHQFSDENCDSGASEVVRGPIPHVQCQRHAVFDVAGTEGLQAVTPEGGVVSVGEARRRGRAADVGVLGAEGSVEVSAEFVGK